MRATEFITENLNNLHDPKYYRRVLAAWEDYYGEGEGKQHLDQYSQIVDALNQRGGTVYRAVWVTPGEQPRLDDPGEHWTTSPEAAEEYLQSNAGSSAFMDFQADHDVDPVAYIISATVGPNSVTNKKVLLAQFADEFEVNLVNPRSAKIAIVKQVQNPFN